MIGASKERLKAKGFDVMKLEYMVRSETGLPADSPDAPLPRGTGLELTIRYPVEDLLNIDRLIGLTPPDSASHIQASGVKMSEYVP